MKATITQIESSDLIDFCYNHGGVRINDAWYDDENKTERFLTQDRRHNSYEYYSYVYISKEIGPMIGMHLVMFGKSYIVATCKDEEGDDCYILCNNSHKVGDIIEFNKKGFMPYAKVPDLNPWGRYGEYY